jgi:RNA polymerase sigma factor (sigma-70 family)
MSHQDIVRLREKAIVGKYKAINKQDAWQTATLIMLENIKKMADEEPEFIMNYLYTHYHYDVLGALMSNNGYQKVSGKWIYLQTVPLHWMLNQLSYNMVFDEDADETAFSKDVLCAINNLSPAERKIIYMHYDMNMSTREIAEELNISRRSVQRKLFGHNRYGVYYEGIIDKLRKTLKPS